MSLRPLPGGGYLFQTGLLTAIPTPTLRYRNVLYLATDDGASPGTFYICDGLSWTKIGGGGGASSLLDLTDVSGTDGAGKAPVSDGSDNFVLTDIATQAELGALSSVYQPLDGDLTSIAALSTTTFGRALLALADAAALRTAAAAAASARTITAGAGLTGGGDLTADRTLDVQVDGSTVEIAADTVRVKDAGITAAKLAAGVAFDMTLALGG